MIRRIRLLAAFARHYVTWLAGGYRVARKAHFKTPERHGADVEALQNAVNASDGPVVSRKRGVGHEARKRRPRAGTSIDLRPLNRVLAVDIAEQTIVVEPLVTIAQLVDATKKFGLAPTVMPEFPGITVGGAIQGLAAESSSHRWGLFHESVVWMDVVLGDGSKIRISREEHEDLFAAIPGSYGSLAIVVLVKLRLSKREKSLIVRHRRMHLDEFLGNASLFNHEFLDAICDRELEVVATTADSSSEPQPDMPRYDPPWWGEYYCDHVSGTVDELGPELFDFADYAFRYDRGAFWIAPTKLGRSTSSRLVWGGFATAANLYRLRRSKQRIDPSPSCRIVQDCIVPTNNAGELVRIIRNVVSGPLWLLPITSGFQNIFGLNPGRWLNIGIYLRPDLPTAEVEAFNTDLESQLACLGGRKTLHAELFYSRDRFDAIYDMSEYERLRTHHHATNRLAHIHEKLGIGDGC